MRQRLLAKQNGAPFVEGTATIRRLGQQNALDEQEQQVYIGWLNWKLASYPNSQDRRHVSQLFEDLSDGVVLCQLAELLTKKSLRYKKTPTVVPMMNDNCSVALNALKDLGCTGVEARNFVETDKKDNNRLVLGFLWQLVQLELNSKNDVFQWAAEYLKGYSGVPANLDASSFRDGRLLSFLLHKAAPGTVNLNAMELQSPKDRLVDTIRAAKITLGVPVMISAEAVADPQTKTNLLEAYLLAFRKCIGEHGEVAAPAAPEEPSEGKFSTMRAGTGRARLQTFRFGAEHKDLKCPVCEEGLDRRGLLVKVGRQSA